MEKSTKVKLFFYNSILPLFSKEEKYELDIRIRKASVSITSNIAEGYGRFHYQEGIQYYRIPRASMYKLKDHLITYLYLKYIERKLFDNDNPLVEEANKTLNGCINYVKNRKKNI